MAAPQLLEYGAATALIAICIASLVLSLETPEQIARARAAYEPIPGFLALKNGEPRGRTRSRGSIRFALH
jgi:hypothetical protein